MVRVDAADLVVIFPKLGVLPGVYVEILHASSSDALRMTSSVRYVQRVNCIVLSTQLSV